LSAFYSGDTYSGHEATGSASAGAKADFVLGRIAKYLPLDAPRTLLDYGAGGGGFLSHARNRSWKLRGCEPGKRGLEACRRAGLDVTDNLEELPPAEFVEDVPAAVVGQRRRHVGVSKLPASWLAQGLA